MHTVSSWGRLRQTRHKVSRAAFLDVARAAATAGDTPALCYGGRSYCDVCLNENGRLIVTDLLDRVISFDRQSGVLAKDATMSVFRAGYPQWRQLEAQRDPVMMSDFWRRVTADAPAEAA